MLLYWSVRVSQMAAASPVLLMRVQYSSSIFMLCFALTVPKKVEIRYLSQLRRSPYPINGVYRIYHRAAHNHFKRHADIKHRGIHSLSPSPLSSLVRFGTIPWS